MGDTGSLTIGMMTCILSLKLLDGFPVNPSMQQPNAFFLAYSPLIIPCFDVVRVYLHRVRKRKRIPFLPDKNHIHHKNACCWHETAYSYDCHCTGICLFYTVQYSAFTLL